MFGQDMEDLDEALRESLTGAGDDPPPTGPATWPDDAFKAQAPRWEKAVAAGLKTPTDILTLARTKGALTPAQEATIRAMKAAPPAPPPADDPFVAEMDAAEGGPQS
jgi:hypothetical protein